MEQFTFGNDFEDAPQIVNASEPHMALLFLVDTSGSMGAQMQDGETGDVVVPIVELNDALNRFKAGVCKDSQTKDILDVAIVEFNETYKVVQEFTPVEYLKPVELIASGRTYMKEALEVSINMVNERSRFYRRAGTEPYKPWIVLISDGAPFDSIDEMAAKINDMVSQEKLAFWSLSIPGADKEVLHKLSGKRVLNLKDYDFEGFLDWAHKSMRAVSASAPGEKVKGQELPPSVTIDDLM